MKNILAENLLRFGLKNADVDVVNKLQSLAEQEEVKPDQLSAGLLLTSGGLGITLAKGATPVSLKTDDASIIVFNLAKELFDKEPAAESDTCVVYRASNDKYIAMGMIGTYDENSNTVTNQEFRAIVFQPVPADDGETGQVKRKVNTPAANPTIVIGRVLKALIPNIGNQGSAYLTNTKDGKALLSGIINMYKMNGQMTDFDINDATKLQNLANRAGRSAAAEKA